MRKASLAVSLVVGLSLLAQAAAAQTRRQTQQQEQTPQWQFGPQVDFGTNNVGLGVGARAVFAGLGNAVKVPGLEAYASFDYFFPSSSFGISPKFWEINVNGTWDIPNMTGGFKPYVGAGLNYAHYSFDCAPFSCSGSNTGLNLLGGTHLKPSPKLNMFGEVRIELRTGSAVVFTLGLLF